MSRTLDMMPVIYTSFKHNKRHLESFIKMKDPKAEISFDPDYNRFIVNGSNNSLNVWHNEYLLYDDVEEVFLSASVFDLEEDD